MGEHDEIIGDFLVESYESLFKLDRDLVTLEEELSHASMVAGIFRTVHSMKSAAGFLSFPRLESLTHQGEALLVRVRDGELPLSKAVIAGLLALVDGIRQILASIEATGGEGTHEFSALEEHLRSLQTNVPYSEAEAGGTSGGARYNHTFLPFTTMALEALVRQEEPVGPRPLDGPLDEEPLPERLGEMLIKTGRVRIEDVVAAVEQQRNGDPRKLGEILIDQASISPEDLLEVLKSQQDSSGLAVPQRIGDLLIQSGHVTEADVAAAVQQQVEGDKRRLGEILMEKAGLRPGEVLQVLNLQAKLATPQVMGQTVRIESALLDRLTNQLAELLQRTSRHRAQCNAASEEFGPIVEGLVEILARLRMQPLATVWNRLPRFVHDLAHSLGKQVKVEMQGKELQVDRAVIDDLKDPLAHLLRNAVDHGIEPPEERVAKGKPPAGTIQLVARLEDEQMAIDVSDDGAGIDAHAMRELAVRRGVITEAQARRLSDRDALRLVFEPGLSMARKVTHVSGRGVGMDVVKSHVERLGGIVDVLSRVGVGTTFRIRLSTSMGGVHAVHDLMRRIEDLKAGGA